MSNKYEGMVVCESYFTGVDPDCPDFIGGIDVYGHLPYGAAEPQHRLTMGKDKNTGEYIAWKRYHDKVEIVSRSGLTGFFEREGKVIKVVFRTKSLPELLRFCNEESRRQWKDNDKPFDEVPCDHHFHHAVFCHAPKETTT